MATAPSSWAGRLAKAPLKEPTGVRAAPTMTMSSGMPCLLEVCLRLALSPAEGAAGVSTTALCKSSCRSVPAMRGTRIDGSAQHILAACAKAVSPKLARKQVDCRRHVPCAETSADGRDCVAAGSDGRRDKEPTVIKKYANRRLYNTGTSTYVTLEDLAEMVKGGEDFVVFDAKTGDDITRSVLTQIIFEQESKAARTCCRSPSCAS